MDFKNINWKYVVVIVVLCIIILNVCSTLYTDRNPTEEFSGTKPLPRSSSDQGEIVLYYASWCGYSRMILPEWEKFESNVKKNMPYLRIRRVRCESDNEALCFQKGVEGYPTIILYLNDGTEVPFKGDRTSEGLLKFINNSLK